MKRVNIGRRAFLAWLARNPYGHRRLHPFACPLAHFLAGTGRPAAVEATTTRPDVGFPRRLPLWAQTGLRAYDDGAPAKEAWK